MRRLLCSFITLLVLSAVALASRSLVVVNGLGETADFVDLTDSMVTLNFDLLGLYPNDFLVSENTGIAINSGSNDLYFYNMETLSRIGTLFLGANRNPWSGAFLHPDSIIITNFVSSTITKIDVPSRTVIAEYPVGDSLDSDSPAGILIIGRKAYICLTSFDELFQYDAGKVEIFDLDANAPLARLTVGINPQNIARGYDGYLYILCTGNYADVEGWIYRLNPQTDSVIDSLFVGGYPGSIAITRQDLAFLAAGGWPPLTSGRANQGGIIYTIDLNSWSLTHGPSNPLTTDWGVVSVKTVSDSSVISCNFSDDTITELDSAGSVLARFHVGDGPVAVAKVPSCFVLPGDVNASETINIADVVYLISFIFSGGPPPIEHRSGDSNCNGITNIADVVAVISFIFGGGNSVCECAD